MLKLVHVPVPADATLVRLARWLPTAELAHATRWRRQADHARHITARAALRWLLSDLLALPPARVPLRRASTGKPELDLPQAPYHFSVAHSGDSVVVACSTQPVGIDIESEPLYYDAALAQAICTPQENVLLSAHPAPPLAFLQLWTAKEAVLKADGRGLSIDPANVDVGLPFRPDTWRPVLWDQATCTYAVAQLEAPAGYVAAVAQGNPSSQLVAPPLVTHTADDLLQTSATALLRSA